MKITIVTTIFPPDIGGPATYSSEILTKLGERGHYIKVVTSSKLAEANPQIYVLPKKSILKMKIVGFLLKNIFLFFYIHKISKNNDIIYVQNPTILGFISLLTAKLLKKPIVLKFVGDKPWETAYSQGQTKKFIEKFLLSPDGGIYIRFLFRLQKFVLNNVNKIIVPSQFLKELLITYYHVDSGNIKVIYNSTNISSQINQSHNNLITQKKPIITTVGRLVKHKQIDQIIYTVKEMISRFPHIQLNIIGDGPERHNLVILANKLKMKKHVKFWGQISHSETIKQLVKSNIFVLNSIYEGLPHVVVESMVCRTPIIATRIKGTIEVVKNEETGILVSSNNPKELKDKIILILKNDKLRIKLIENAYKMFEQNFSWKKNLNTLEKTLEEEIRMY